MNVRRLAALAALVLTSTACAHDPFSGSLVPQDKPRPPTVSVKWKANTADLPAATTSAAKQFFPGDAKKIDAAHGQFLGRVSVVGDSRASEDAMAAKAAAEAASHGGTHVFLVEEKDDEKTEVTRAAGSFSHCYPIGNNVYCSATETPAQTRTTVTQVRQFAVFAVAPQQWSALPKPLVPSALQ